MEFLNWLMINIHAECQNRFEKELEYKAPKKHTSNIIPLVSVIVITYQQYSYIKDCLDGILMQKTNFPIEIIIGDDESVDGTREFCIKYADRYPDKIRLFLRDRKSSQLYDKNGQFICRFNAVWAMMSSRGKYTAVCEGDDYWIDPLKLQKQVDFMQKSENVSFCFHNAKTYYVDKNSVEKFNKHLHSGYFFTKDLLFKEWFIPTASLLFRKELLPSSYPEWYYKAYSGDLATELLLSIRGSFYYIDEMMSVYRKNAINSLSATQIASCYHLYRKRILIHDFAKKQSIKIKILALYSSIIVTSQIFRAIIYQKFPLTMVIKNQIKKMF
jgi:glycosyltransferase involved in cell wall biosynthesis